MNSKLLSEFAGALTLVFLIPAGLMLASFAPQDNALVVILGSLRLHLCAIIFGLGLVLLLVGRLARALVGFGIVLAVAVHTALALAPSLTPPAPADARTVTVMSFNILAENTQNGDAIADFILSAGPDIVFVQEARPLRRLLDRLATVYPYRIGCDAGRSCDSMLLSRHRLAGAEFYMSDTRAARRLYTTSVTIDGQRIALAGIHLTKAEYGNSQAAEYRIAAEQIAALTDPVIVAGDFNTAPWAPRFIDFLAATGLGRALIEPATWPGDSGLLDALGLPIDHILVRGGAIESLENLPSSFGSNHRGLIARIAVPQ
ncbi:MAG: endonuclease/exonuclease/phosphatase family protein [Alphaproteobacteria bacterium]|nr:endonuclease/exonuclease/phosphatase family protein [Alphaproteobacteria bacterium]